MKKTNNIKTQKQMANDIAFGITGLDVDIVKIVAQRVVLLKDGVLWDVDVTTENITDYVFEALREDQCNEIRLYLHEDVECFSRPDGDANSDFIRLTCYADYRKLVYESGFVLKSNTNIRFVSEMIWVAAYTPFCTRRGNRDEVFRDDCVSPEDLLALIELKRTLHSSKRLGPKCKFGLCEIGI
jgi:hypothetical protein